MVKNFKEKLDTISEQKETLTKMYTVKKNQVEILEIKNTISQM